ncbi:hypothetical protein [Streptococcus marimammalium]|uniref:hypothetical protein n=1 Tax=Streptococcus marimammalium TaxID=269666 RepID=UPI000377D5DF|nr:hypothetical protein [Streptococcus marimammalium]
MDTLKKMTFSREKIELITVFIILILGMSVFLIPLKTKTVLTYNDGKIHYTGYVVNYRMNGKGKLTFENGDVYEGNFVNGMFNGKGIFISNIGWSYEGDFKDGQADGQGKLIAKDKKVYEGTFKQGIYQK